MHADHVDNSDPRPDAAIVRLLKAAQQLAHGTFGLVAGGLGLDRLCIESDLDLDEVVRRSPRTADLDNLERSRRLVHARCAGIVSFASSMSVELHLTADQAGRVASSRLACRAAVDLVRDIAGLQPNVSFYLRGDNPAMLLQYELIRRGIARCLRQLAGLVSADDPTSFTDVVAGVDRAARRRDALADGTVHRLLRGSAITPTMAGALMTDSARALATERRLVALATCIIAAAATADPTPHSHVGGAVTPSEASWAAS